MPALLLPVTLSAPVIASDDSLPALFQTNRLPDCPVLLLNTPAGTIGQQELPVNGFLLSLQSIRLPPEETLVCSCSIESAILLFVWKGNLNVSTATGNLVMMRESLYYLMTSKADSRISLSLSGGPVHLFQLAFSLRMLHKLLGGSIPVTPENDNKLINDVPVFPFHLPITTPLQRLFTKLTSKAWTTGPNQIIRLHRACLNMLEKFTNDSAVYYTQQRWLEKKQLSMTELAGFLQDHLDISSRSQVTLTACAKRTQLDSSSFKRLFRSHYGMTLAKYLYQQRMQKAFSLLTQSGRLPGMIYGEVGYHDFSSFSRAFSKYFNQPPSAVSMENK